MMFSGTPGALGCAKVARFDFPANGWQTLLKIV
jgi:hypothetical protein